MDYNSMLQYSKFCDLGVLSKEQLEVIKEGLEMNIPVERFIDSSYTPEQLRELFNVADSIINTSYIFADTKREKELSAISNYVKAGVSSDIIKMVIELRLYKILNTYLYKRGMSKEEQLLALRAHVAERLIRMYQDGTILYGRYLLLEDIYADLGISGKYVYVYRLRGDYSPDPELFTIHMIPKEQVKYPKFLIYYTQNKIPTQKYGYISLEDIARLEKNGINLEAGQGIQNCPNVSLNLEDEKKFLHDTICKWNEIMHCKDQYPKNNYITFEEAKARYLKYLRMDICNESLQQEFMSVYANSTYYDYDINSYSAHDMNSFLANPEFGIHNQPIKSNMGVLQKKIFNTGPKVKLRCDKDKKKTSKTKKEETAFFS